MSNLVERLRDTVQILATTQMNLSMEDWDKVSNAILDAAGAIKRLRDDNAELTRRETEAADEIEKLRAALRPFADVARDWPDADPDVECGVGVMFVADGKAKIYFRDFHAARAAMGGEDD